MANPGRYSKSWGKRLEKDFKKVLEFYKKSTPEERARFEAGELEGLVVKDSWSRISNVTPKKKSDKRWLRATVLFQKGCCGDWWYPTTAK